MTVRTLFDLSLPEQFLELAMAMPPMEGVLVEFIRVKFFCLTRSNNAKELEVLLINLQMQFYCLASFEKSL